METALKKSWSIGLAVFLAAAITACGGNTDQKKNKEANVPAGSAAITQADTTTAPEAKLNMNTASEEAFKTIPKVGDHMVNEFKEYRPYTSIQQFRKEIGKYVDEAQVAAYEQYIYVPIHRNESNAETLRQIPGLDADEAEKIIAARPYDSNKAFLKALEAYVNQEQLATATTYLKAE